MSDELGRVTWAGGRRTAILRADRTWECDAAGMADDLAEIYPPGDPALWGPSAGRPGSRALEGLARALGGRAEYSDDEGGATPGRVY